MHVPVELWQIIITYACSCRRTYVRVGAVCRQWRAARTRLNNDDVVLSMLESANADIARAIRDIIAAVSHACNINIGHNRIMCSIEFDRQIAISRQGDIIMIRGLTLPYNNDRDELRRRLEGMEISVDPVLHIYDCVRMLPTITPDIIRSVMNAMTVDGALSMEYNMSGCCCGISVRTDYAAGERIRPRFIRR